MTRSRLTSPLYELCDVCRRNWTRIVKMETFTTDLRDLLRSRGVGWLPLSHLNSHSRNKTLSAGDLTSLFSDVPPSLTRWRYTSFSQK